MQALTWALKHDKRQKGGLRLQDVDKLSPLQWAAWEGLSEGRDKYEGESNKRRKQQTPSAAMPMAPPPQPRRH